MLTNTGIHHITAIASKPKPCVQFYSDILGLRLVKKSVNQDQVEAYHLFFGDYLGEPGMDLTFFTFDPIHQGVRGAGVTSLISLTVPEKSLGWWQQRFTDNQVRHEPIETRFGLPRLLFFDEDDQRLELVGVPDQHYQAAVMHHWSESPVPEEHQIAAFHSARLSVLSESMVLPILEEILGFEKTTQAEDGVHLYQLPDAVRAAYLEVEEHPSDQLAQSGAGTVHHIAFQVEDAAELEIYRSRLIELGYYPTQVIDRYYFKSVYFRTPAGILFELATNGPGFAVDEPVESLGEKLALPPFLEDERAEIEAGLEPI